MNEMETILDFHGIRKTASRKDLLRLFHDVRSSLTVEEIQSKIGASYDKATIYRTLDTFEKNGLIHQVPDKNNLVRYALCKKDSVRHEHHHAHLICDVCHETFCLEEIEPPKLKMINGFNIRTSRLTLEGVCPDCMEMKDQKTNG